MQKRNEIIYIRTNFIMWPWRGQIRNFDQSQQPAAWASLLVLAATSQMCSHALRFNINIVKAGKTRINSLFIGSFSFIFLCKAAEQHTQVFTE